MPPKRTRGGAPKGTSSTHRGPTTIEASVAANEQALADDVAAFDTPSATDPGIAAAEVTESANVVEESSTSVPSATEASNASAPSLTRTTSGHGGARGRASAPAPRASTRKSFAPRTVIRRSQAERDATSAAEAKKAEQIQRENEARAAAEKRRNERIQRMRQGSNDRGRGRGRGGYMGDRRAGISGPFSQGVVEAKQKVFVPHSKHGAVKGEPDNRGGVRVKTEDGGSSSGPSRASRRVVRDDGHGDVVMTGGKQEDGGYISSDDEETGGPRRDVDTINLISDEEDGGARRERAPSASLRPVRLKRVNHRDRRAGVTTETGRGDAADDMDDEIVEGDKAEHTRSGATGRTKSKAKGKDVQFMGENRIWQGVHPGEDDAKPRIKEEPMDDDTEMATATAAPSELRPHSPEQSRRNKTKSRAAPGILGNDVKEPPFNTVQEKEEWTRYQEDLRAMLDELADIGVADDEQEAHERMKSERIYLFQFPPILPELCPASQNVKPEPDVAPASPKQTKRAATVAPKADPDQPIKVEDDAPGTAPSHIGPKMEAGALGKLRVHQSGKVTLNYGGTSLQLNKGVDASFLQDAVITRLPAPGDFGMLGSAYALGPVRGKFVVTPDFEAVVGGKNW